MKTTTPDEADRRTRLIEQLEQQIVRLTQRGQERFEQILRPVGLTIPQFLALRAIEQMGPEVTMTEIGEAIHAPPSSMTSIVDRLVAMGLAERDRPSENRRIVIARTTEQGAHVVRTIESQRHDDFVEMIGVMTDAQIDQFSSILVQLNGGIEDLTINSDNTNANKR